MTEFRFIHSSDLHLGRRFSNLPEDVRGRLVEARHQAIDAVSGAAREHGAGHVLIAGDLFDTETPSDRIWRQASAAMASAQELTWWFFPETTTASPRRHCGRDSVKRLRTMCVSLPTQNLWKLHRG